MVAQFQGLLSPFIVLFTIPLAFTGGLIGLMITGEDISMIAMMGFLILAGVVVNNGIVFVDYTNQLRLAGMEKKEALVETGKARMRPILMTAMTTAFVENPPVKEHLSQFGVTTNRTTWDPNAPLDRNNLDPAIHSPFDLTHCDINTIQHMDVIDGFIHRFEAEATALMNVRPLRHDERVQYDKLVVRKNWIFYLEEMQVKGWGDTDYNPHLFQPSAPFSTCA